MSRETFDTQYKDDRSYQVTGELLNRQNRALNRLSSRVAGSPGRSSIVGAGIGDILPQNALVGVAQIKDASETCDNPDRPDEDVEAPCKSEGLYLAVFRYYSWIDKEWKELDENLPLDTSVFGDDSARPTFVENDVIPCFWDHQRGMLIPMSSVSAPRDLLGRPQTRLATSTRGLFDIYEQRAGEITVINNRTELAWNFSGIEFEPDRLYRLMHFADSDELIADPLEIKFCESF